MRKKKLTAWILTVTMTVSMCGMTVLAEEVSEDVVQVSESYEETNTDSVVSGNEGNDSADAEEAADTDVLSDSADAKEALAGISNDLEEKKEEPSEESKVSGQDGKETVEEEELLTQGTADEIDITYYRIVQNSREYLVGTSEDDADIQVKEDSKVVPRDAYDLVYAPCGEDIYEGESRDEVNDLQGWAAQFPGKEGKYVVKAAAKEGSGYTGWTYSVFKLYDAQKLENYEISSDRTILAGMDQKDAVLEAWFNEELSYQRIPHFSLSDWNLWFIQTDKELDEFDKLGRYGKVEYIKNLGQAGWSQTFPKSAGNYIVVAQAEEGSGYTGWTCGSIEIKTPGKDLKDYSIISPSFRTFFCYIVEGEKPDFQVVQDGNPKNVVDPSNYRLEYVTEEAFEAANEDINKVQTQTEFPKIPGEYIVIAKGVNEYTGWNGHPFEVVKMPNSADNFKMGNDSFIEFKAPVGISYIEYTPLETGMYVISGEENGCDKFVYSFVLDDKKEEISEGTLYNDLGTDSSPDRAVYLESGKTYNIGIQCDGDDGDEAVDLAISIRKQEDETQLEWNGSPMNIRTDKVYKKIHFVPEKTAKYSFKVHNIDSYIKNIRGVITDDSQKILKSGELAQKAEVGQYIEDDLETSFSKGKSYNIYLYRWDYDAMKDCHGVDYDFQLSIEESGEADAPGEPETPDTPQQPGTANMTNPTGSTQVTANQDSKAALLEKAKVAKSLFIKKGKSKTVKVKLPKKLKKLSKKGKKGKKGVARISYKTSNKKIATVNSKGKIKAKKKGTVKITVTIKLKDGTKKTFTTKVTVK